MFSLVLFVAGVVLGVKGKDYLTALWTKALDKLKS
jgi:hypothetical protein